MLGAGLAAVLAAELGAGLAVAGYGHCAELVEPAGVQLAELDHVRVDGLRWKTSLRRRGRCGDSMLMSRSRRRARRDCVKSISVR